MNLSFTYKTLLLFPAMLLLLGGCIREDRSDCGMRLWVLFDAPMYELPSGEHRIGHIDVFAFDGHGRYVRAWITGVYDYHAGQPYEIPVDLEPGTYTFVAWTNTGTEYRFAPAIGELIPGVTTLSELKTYLHGPADRRFEAEIPDLHYGRLEGAVADRSRKTEYTLYLIPDTYRINLRVKGLEEIGEAFAISLSDNNGLFNFLNRVIGEKIKDQHLRQGTVQQGNVRVSFRSLSLTDDHAIENIGHPGNADRSPTLRIIHRTDGAEIFSGDLVKIIRGAYSKSGQTVDFDKTYLFDIIFSFDAEMNLTVTVNGWSYSPNPVEL
ncbi:MAG: FimB/Mfa2 family fimbrial subunit [Rikenellaceae bacterium]|nr:FimB/Mfa2 family fimbrial subunit [Rikenellaceae bacterium]